MALQMSKAANIGITIPQAYIRVVSYNGDISNIRCTVVTHASAAARQANDEEVERKVYTFTAPSGNVGTDMMAWAYAQLKALPEFSTALDV